MIVSTGAAFVPRDYWHEIINDAMKEAERMNLGDKDYVIFDEHNYGLKIVIHWGKKQVNIMTKEEADAGGLPNKPQDFGPSKN